jgi:multidrug efflux system membrane fusion protein
VIAAGIDEGERVVTTGFSQLTDGAKIAIGTQDDLQRPAGSERRRRGTPRETPAARSEPTPRAPLPTTPSPGATPQSASSEPSRDGAQRTQSGGTTTATP